MKAPEEAASLLAKKASALEDVFRNRFVPFPVGSDEPGPQHGNIINTLNSITRYYHESRAVSTGEMVKSLRFYASVIDGCHKSKGD